jgi:hypothetical protein
MSSTEKKEPEQLDPAQVLMDSFCENYPKAEPNAHNHTMTTGNIFAILNGTAPKLLLLEEVAPLLLQRGYKLKKVEENEPLQWCISLGETH